MASTLKHPMLKELQGKKAFFQITSELDSFRKQNALTQHPNKRRDQCNNMKQEWTKAFQEL